MDIKELNRLLDCLTDGEYPRKYSGSALAHWFVSHSKRPGAALDAMSIRLDVRERDEGGLTPLHAAAEFNRDRRGVDFLIGLGADTKVRDRSGKTPLDRAAAFNDCEAVVVALIEAGADVNAACTDGATPLHWAARRNPSPNVVSALLDAGADVDSRAHDDETPLHWAALAWCAENARRLIDGGADVNAVDKRGSDTAARGRTFLPAFHRRNAAGCRRRPESGRQRRQDRMGNRPEQPEAQRIRCHGSPASGIVRVGARRAAFHWPDSVRPLPDGICRSTGLESVPHAVARNAPGPSTNVQ